MKKLRDNEKGNLIANTLIFLAIALIFVASVIGVLFYVNSLFESEDFAYAGNLQVTNRDYEIKLEGYRYLTQGKGSVKLLGLSEEYIKDSIVNSKLSIPSHIEFDKEEYQVTEIASRAFENILREVGVREVELPTTVKEIGSYAFSNNGLENIVMSDSVECIGSSAFQDNNLKEIILSKALVKLSDSSFKNNKLESVLIPEKLKDIGSSAFENNNLKKIEFNEAVEVIREDSFANNSLVEINLPESLRRIDADSFKGNDISKVVIPKDVDLEDSAIQGRFGDAYYFSLGEGGTYTRRDEILYSWDFTKEK